MMLVLYTATVIDNQTANVDENTIFWAIMFCLMDLNVGVEMTTDSIQSSAERINEFYIQLSNDHIVCCYYYYLHTKYMTIYEIILLFIANHSFIASWKCAISYRKNTR